MKKKKKHHTIIYYLSISIVILIFVAISASVIFFQTSFGKEKVKMAMISYANKNGIDLKFDKIDGVLPFQYLLKNVSIQTQNTKLDIQELSFRIKFLPLLKKDLSFSSFQAKTIKVAKQISDADQNQNSSKKVKDNETASNTQIYDIFLVSLPIKINFDKIRLIDLELKIDDTLLSLDVSGKGKLLKFSKILSFNLKIQRNDFKNSYLDIFFKAYKKNKFFKCNSNLFVATSEVLTPFYKTDRDFSFNINIDSSGNFKSFDSLDNLFSKINGQTKGIIFKIDNIPPSLNLESNFSFDFSMLNDSSINISKGFLKNDLFEIYIDALIDKNFNLQKSNLTLRVDELKKINNDLLGSFLSKTVYENKKFETNFEFKDFLIDDISFIDFKGNLNGSYSNEILEAKLGSSAFTLNETFAISSDLKFEKFNLNISNLNITSPSINLLANFDLNSSLNLIGQGNINFNDLAPIGVMHPKILFNGNGNISFKFLEEYENDEKFQNINLDVTLQNYFLETLYGNSAKIYLTIQQKTFSKPVVDIKSSFKDLKYHDLKINEINFSSNTELENWPYELKLIANLKKPIELESEGFFKIHEKDITINIQDLKGNLFSNSFISPKPILIAIKKDTLQISDLAIEFADSSILADIDFSNKASKAMVSLKNFPLDFLSINPLDLDVTGYLDLNFEIEKQTLTKGFLDIDVKNIEILALGDEKPLKASGLLKSKIQNDYFNLESFLKLKNTQLITLNGKIPIDLDLASLKVNINDNKDLSLDANYNGKVEELLDFINIGPQRLEGDLKADLHLSNTLKNIKTSGFCSFENGYFENYYTGTILKEISAQMKAQDEKIILEYLKGKDPENGKIEADGVFSLSQKKNFPFYFKTQIDNLLCVDSNMIRSKATAIIEISGDSISSLAKGNVKANYLDMAIPDQLPIIIPDLKATFISHPSKNHEKYIEKPKMYPIHLDFDLDVTNPIKIHGQGLDSTWRGNFKIGGTYMNFETRGHLELLKGSYVFSGRHFNLTKGKVSFTGKPNEMPILDIQATITQRGVQIIADVKGPLDSPKITFSSSPALPSSSIMALLIFGQQLNELTESQTIELASTMSQELGETSLSSSNALANLGIDRFNIIKPSDTDPLGSDQMSVQFGKYITKGIVVSLSQGAEQGSSNIIVEVDLKKGFIFQAETQQQEEQGKFSLKWRRNY